MFNFYIDFLIRRARNSWIRFLRESRMSATVIFSILNAFILTGMMKKSTVSFWFASAPCVKNESDENSNVRENDTNDSCKLIHGDIKCSDFIQSVSIWICTNLIKFIHWTPVALQTPNLNISIGNSEDSENYMRTAGDEKCKTDSWPD